MESNFGSQFDIENFSENPYLDWIKEGFKLFEGRTKEKVTRCNLKIGSNIKIYDKANPASYVICEIVDLLYYADFGEAFDALGDKLIPNKTKNEVIRMYNKLYVPDEFEDGVTANVIIAKGGAVAIGIKVIYSQ